MWALELGAGETKTSKALSLTGGGKCDVRDIPGSCRSTEVWSLRGGVVRESFLGEVAPAISSMGSTFWGRGVRREEARVLCIGKSHIVLHTCQ